jgi:hypothetical protein
LPQPERDMEFGHLDCNLARNRNAIGLSSELQPWVGPIYAACPCAIGLSSGHSMFPTWVGPIFRPEGPAPQGLQNSAQGFNPGKPHNNRFALKGREMRLPEGLRTNRSNTHFRLVRTFDLTPLQGAPHTVVVSQGKPWAVFSSPFGAQIPSRSSKLDITLVTSNLDT